MLKSLLDLYCMKVYMVFTAFLRLIRWDKPIGTLLLLWPTLTSLVVATNGSPSMHLIIVFALGVFLTRSSGCAINDIVDADLDKHVERTKNRPIANGKISKSQALLFSVILVLLSFILAISYLHYTSLLMSIPALIIFTLYPFMKRFFPIPQAYLGIAFSFGILMVFMEVHGQLSFIAWVLFFANVFWVLGYDTIYSLMDKSDDLRVGVKSSAITFGKHVITFIFICYFIYAILCVYVGNLLKLGFLYYLACFLADGLLIYQVIALIKSGKPNYLRLFLLNNWVGLIVFIGLIFGFR